MEQIKLTKENKSKLLEMCNKLFPEYDDILFSPITFDILMFNGTKKDTVYIHWFEFCSRYLMSKLDNLYFEKIMYPVDPYSKQNQGKNLKYPDNWQKLWSRRPFLMFTSNLNGISYKKHPIDYLYSEFLKLSK